MKKVFLILSLLLCVFVFAQNEKTHYPINTNGEFVELLDNSDDNYLQQENGKFYAFDAKITQIETAYQNKPYIEVELQNGQRVWIGSLINKQKYIKVNNIIRVLGIVSSVQAGDEIATKFNPKKYHILMFAFLDIKSLKAVSFEGALGQAEEWRDGTIPKSLSNN